MPKRIPVSAANQFAKDHGLEQVIILAWDGERTHIVTAGHTQESCVQAAEGGNRVQEYLGWPESLRAQPSIVKKLRAEIAELRRRLEENEQRRADPVPQGQP